MSWYSSPIQPIDPVVQSQAPKPSIRYVRDNFASSGQNSYVKPPAQDPAQWQQLLNVQPITQGILNQRWGYNPFTSAFTLSKSTSVVSASSPGSFIPIATLVVASTAGLAVGQTVVVANVSDNLFNGTWTILAVADSTHLSLNWLSLSAVHNGTGGTLTLNQAIACNRLYNFQSDALGTRTIIAASLSGIIGYNEDGTVYNSDIFAPVSTSGIVRSLTSRNYQYFCDGNNTLNTKTHLTGDSLKWNGAAIGGVSNIGIVNADVTSNVTTGGGSSQQYTSGPNTGTNVADVATTPAHAWLSPSGIYSNNFSTAAINSIIYGTPNFLTTDTLQATGFFSSIPVANTVNGIQVTVQTASYFFAGTTSTSGTLHVQLLKNGNPVGNIKTATLTVDAFSPPTRTITLGSATDVWGASFVPSDLVQGNFGFQFYFTGTATPPTQNHGFQIRVPFVQMTATFSNNQGTTNNSGTGVGVAGSATGSVNLSVGRIYYLIGNNSITGHFSDLSNASISTGPIANGEFNLVLATYNDPQVDTKYVLATADGGDPSILYQVQCLVPGFIVSSWAIAGNVVTFTGGWLNNAISPIGTSVVVGGLAHGSYLDGQTLITTNAAVNTLTANFTHANDSATEIGVVGNYSFAIPNAVAVVVDNNPDPNLVLNQAMVFTDQFGATYGVALNQPPPAGDLFIKHQGRLWMAGVPGATHSVFFSKSVSELTLPNGFIAGKYEEAWPGSNYFDVSDGAESVSGFLSDGNTLYIGTQNHIRRLLGNSPTNFQQPQIVHPQVGLINQEVWQIVYMQGTPSGSIWMTPDFRVIQSDFNTYVDIGNPIQDILNNLQPSAASLAHAAFVSDGEFDFYILAVPFNQSTFCDTHLVFELKTRQWYTWQPATGSLALLFNITAAGTPQWLFINGVGAAIDIYQPTATTDNGVAIPVSATTTWMHLGEPTRRKLLNEVQIYGNTGMTITITGANNLADFSIPNSVVYSRTLKQSPFGTWNLYLTGTKTKYRYYQFTFAASNGAVPFLGAYAIASSPLDDL